ncbi:MAG: hypothetical protein E7039_05385 [Lentisphaerae bacterium]|nr:hypothetical protein [Lentisphaerota bacterium]
MKKFLRRHLILSQAIAAAHRCSSYNTIPPTDRPPLRWEQSHGQCDWDGQAVEDGNVKKGSYS